MYIAQRRFSNTPQGTTTTTTYKPGDVIHDFADWPEHAKRSLVNTGMVHAAIGAPPGLEKTTQSDSVETSAEVGGPGRAAPKQDAKRPGRKK